ncbi:acyl-CoA hydrolase [Melghirimyces profundicolus]|uniref:Acyl-CoA hydrolase n=1 Tax=Melghirimyces profundicolus TaxID=1242148 RepID=A0A2T6BV58_9BACL|nr:acyl-CoA thioesterase [Melghirimyces profundicolus]PTX59965.1 acyl-CoA hydrolase [Melghirimyces profundicolus]
MKQKSAAESKTELTDIILPPQTNHHGTIFGGEVMSYIDRVAVICASRHANAPVVTASFDSMDFLSPLKVGECIILSAIVRWVGKSSMEVQVIVEGEDLVNGTRHITGVCFVTMVAVNKEGKAIDVPPLKLNTEEEHFQFERGKERALRRKRRRKGYH